MITRFHIPAPPLSDYVNVIWLFTGFSFPHSKERVLPNGAVELVINLHEDLIRSYDRNDPDRFEALSGCIVAGTRSEYMVIDTDCQDATIGINFKPGGAFHFFGLPVCELHGIDLSLDTLWGRDAIDLRERLLEDETPETRFRILEEALRSRLGHARPNHAAVAFALRELAIVPNARKLADMADEIGLSQRRFIELFREEVGMTPKLYYRIRRFQKALRRIEQGEHVEWAELALDCGYYDQAHFIRDFREFSGINPSTYIAQRGDRFNHIPL